LMIILVFLILFRCAECVVSLNVPEREVGTKGGRNIAIELQADAGQRQFGRSTRANRELLRSEPPKGSSKPTLIDSLDVQSRDLASLASRNIKNVERKVEPENATICISTNGLQMDSGTQVLAIEDLSDCGDDVKDLGDFNDANNALQSCSEKVEGDAECSLKFVMQDSTDECKCVKKGNNCAKRNTTNTCVYQLMPPICANTTDFLLMRDASTHTLDAVYPVGFDASCSNATSLGTFPDGLENCANAVLDDPTCGDTFEFHRTRFDCLCLKNGTTCTSHDSNGFCLYQVY